MRVAILGAVACLILPFGPAVRSQDDPRKRAELEWAREVVDDFFTAVGSRDAAGRANARSLLAEEQRVEFAEGGDGWRMWSGQKLEAITRSVILFDQDEAVFEGRMSYNGAPYTFKMRVVKAGPRGPWRIAYLRGKEQPKAR
jgi:hypothetical protein